MDRLTKGQYVQAEAAWSAVNDVMAELEVLAEMFENATSKTEPEHFLARENICRRSLKVGIEGLCDASEQLCGLSSSFGGRSAADTLQKELDEVMGPEERRE